MASRLRASRASEAEPVLHRTRPADLFPVAHRPLLSHLDVAAGPVSESFGHRRALAVSMSHKAFAFDRNAFDLDFGIILLTA